MVWWYRKGKGGFSLAGVGGRRGWMGVWEVLNVITWFAFEV